MNKEITESIFFRHNPEPMWVFDVETLRFLDVNNVALEKYGYSQAEFLAMGIDYIRPPEDVAALRSFLQEPFTIDEMKIWRHRLKCGQIIHVSTSGYPIRYQGKEAMLVTAHNVSRLVELQRENAELLGRERLVRQDAEDAARYFQSLFETIPGKFLVVTPGRYEIVAVSDAYLSATMQKRADIKGRVLFDVFPDSPDDPEADGVNNLRASLERAGSKKVTDVMPVQHYPIPRPVELGGGFEDRYWSAVNTPINGVDGKVAYIVHRVEDVTELVRRSHRDGKRALEELATSHTQLLELDIELRSQELKAAQHRSRTLSDQLITALESMSDAFFTLDASWRFTYMNAQAETVLARDRAELLGKVVWEAFPAALNTQFESQYKRAISTNCTVRFVEFYPPLDKWFEVNAYPSTDSLAVYFRDITENRLRDDLLRQSQKMDVLGQLTGGIAHDFNNLLTVIMGNAELLALKLNDNIELRNLANMAASAAGKGAELTSRLLAFARRQTLNPSILDVNRLVDDMAPLLQRALTENIAIVPRRAAELWAIEADATQLESAILNIALNARDAMPDGGELVVVTDNLTVAGDDLHGPRGLVAGDYVVIAISDTGSGMSADVLDRVFEPFFTTKEMGKGSGLGLSMVFGFVQQSKGYVDIESSPGEGTRISLYFPAHPHPARCITRPAGSVDAVRGGAEHILLVEDNDLVRDYVANQLQALGYQVTTANSGPQALEIAESLDKFDLLLTDIVMPGGMSGIDLAKAVRLRRSNVRVLYTSGFTDGAFDEGGKLPAGIELLTKPYKRVDLATKVRAVLDKLL